MLSALHSEIEILVKVVKLKEKNHLFISYDFPFYKKPKFEQTNNLKQLAEKRKFTLLKIIQDSI